jgi:hypothetical protein
MCTGFNVNYKGIKDGCHKSGLGGKQKLEVLDHAFLGLCGLLGLFFVFQKILDW